MDKQQFTALIHLKGWRVDEFLAHYGRSYDWYTYNCNSEDSKVQLRLRVLIDGLRDK